MNTTNALRLAGMSTSTAMWLAVLAGAVSVPVMAQDNAAALGDDDIIVTARKREETSISVPVAVTALGAAELQRRSISDLDAVARIVPQLVIGPSSGSTQGGNVSLRGISGPDANPMGDQAVSFNIDGVQVSKSSVRSLSNFDMAQLEVLKGPQALFFGKNSPAGIITIRSADPTASLEAKISGGYEFNAREVRGEAYVSGPLSETLGFRVAGFVSRMSGYFKNNVPANSYLASTSDSRAPRDRTYAGRLTLKWEPTDQFDARFKAAYSRFSTAGRTATTQILDCPNGSPMSGAIDNCKADGSGINTGVGPDVYKVLPGFSKSGRAIQRSNQAITSLEMNYRPNDNLTLTSVTGYYYFKTHDEGNYQNDTEILIPALVTYGNKEFSQEFRLSSSYDGPINFTGGLFYSRTNARIFTNALVLPLTTAGGNALNAGFGLPPGTIPTLPDLIAALGPGATAADALLFYPDVSHFQGTQRGQTYSAYLQLQFKPIDQIEIDAGGRYTQERKRIPLLRAQAIGAAYHPLTAADDIPSLTGPRKARFSDFSPEVTISYRPNDDVNLYTNYKHGFLSGGFNISSTDFAQNISYRPETVKGFEAGAKLRLLDGNLRLNFNAYTYQADDLQLTVFRQTNAFLTNAGSSRIKGLEGDFQYRTPLDGLSLKGAASYNKARYTRFDDASCYNGQTAAQGCVNGKQNLAGRPLPRAPKYTFSGGFNYETPLTEALRLGLSADVNYSASYFTDQTDAPRGKQSGYALVDATARLYNGDDAWELALVGRNLTNKYYYVSSLNISFTNDRFGAVSRGREVLLRASYKFGS